MITFSLMQTPLGTSIYSHWQWYLLKEDKRKKKDKYQGKAPI